MMRCIGRWRSDESPSNSLLKGRPAKSPDNSRIVVPELPQSTGLPGAQSPSQPFPSTHNAVAVAKYFDAHLAKGADRARVVIAA